MGQACRLVLLVASFVFMACAARAESCSCRDTAPACQVFSKTDAVFDGTVVSIRPFAPPRETVVAACGFAFEVGHRYQVFASTGPPPAMPHVSLCSPTQRYGRSDDTARFLSSLDEPPPGGRIYGTVQSPPATGGSAQPDGDPVVTMVKLTGPSFQPPRRSAAGKYEFIGLPAGAYRLEATVPDGYVRERAERRVTIVDSCNCARENFSFSLGGRITGRIADHEGRALVRFTIEAATPDALVNSSYGPMPNSARTDADGFFELRGLVPGRYIVGINLQDLPNKSNRYPRIAYPGPGSEPHVIDVSSTQAVDLSTWQLPAPLAVVRVTGTVVWDDGAPAAGVFIVASDRTDGSTEGKRGVGSATSGSDGRFVLELLDGRLYSFEVRGTDAAFLRTSAPRSLVGTAPADALRIVVSRQ